MPSIPPLEGAANHAPHVYVLGAGASIAAYHDWGKIGPKLPSMQDLVSVLSLTKEISDFGFDTNNLNFESFYDELVRSGEHDELRQLVESKVYEYFSSLRLPDSPTLYDYLILGLREKDLIATFNWDPFLLQAYLRNESFAGKQRPQVVHLHGNVNVGVCMEDRVTGIAGNHCSRCGQLLTPSKLLYPVMHKNYSSDDFISNEWDILRRTLRYTYYLSVYGYSAPKTDVEARKLMLDNWQENEMRELAEFEIVDIKDGKELEGNWNEFYVRRHYSIKQNIFRSYAFRFPRRSCDAFASASLMLKPWTENPFPRFDSLEELQSWVQPLLREELDFEESQKPFSGEPLLPNRRSAL